MSKCCAAYEIPDTEHYAIIVFNTRTIHHERLRKHPDHSYPAYTQTIIEQEYYSFFTKQDWSELIHSLELKRNNGADFTFAAIEVKRKVKVNSKIIVEME